MGNETIYWDDLIWRKYHNTSRNRDFSYPDRMSGFGIFKQNRDNPDEIGMVGQSAVMTNVMSFDIMSYTRWYRDRGATLRMGGHISDSILGGGGG